MTSTQIRNEEREMRAMVKASRAAKKLAAKKERKQRLIRAKKGESAPEAEKKRYKLKGAIILKSELASNAAAGEQSSPESKTVKKGGRRSKQLGENSVPTPPKNAVEPPFNYEIHIKNHQVLVNVTLHKVPPHCIDVEGTTATTLVVQTPKYTKKYFLAFTIPSDLKIDVSKADYTFDTGVLKCILPIAGKVSEEVLQEREKLVESFKSQRALRFRVSRDGDLVVRSRRALLKQEAAEPQKKKTAKSTTTAQDAPDADTRVANSDDLPSTEQASSSSTVTIKKSKQETKKELSSAPKAKHEDVVSAKQNSASKASVPPQPQGAPKKKFVGDGADMLAIAKAAAASQRGKIVDKLSAAKEIQQRRAVRMETRETRKSTKREKEQDAFNRVIAEQKRQLLERASLATPAPKNTNPNKKSVSFN